MLVLALVEIGLEARTYINSQSLRCTFFSIANRVASVVDVMLGVCGRLRQGGRNEEGRLEIRPCCRRQTPLAGRTRASPNLHLDRYLHHRLDVPAQLRSFSTPSVPSFCSRVRTLRAISPYTCAKSRRAWESCAQEVWKRCVVRALVCFECSV